MNIGRKKLFLIFALFLMLIGIIFLYYFLGYGVIENRTSKEDCEKIEEDAYKKATEALQREDFDSIAVENLCHYQMFGKFILKNRSIIKNFNKTKRGYSGNSLSYFPENIRNEAENLWKKCSSKTLSINIHRESVIFRINGYGKHIYYSTIYHDITVSEKPIKFSQETYNKKYQFESNVIYEIFFGIEPIEGCDN